MESRKIPPPLISGAALAAVIGATVGVAPVSATPGQTSATLFVVQDSVNAGNYRVAVVGRFPMPQADAVGFLNNLNNGDCDGHMNYYVYGDDPGDPDRYIHHETATAVHDDANGYLKASSQGLEFRREILLRKNFLNEDSGALDDNDEVYAQAHFVDSDCKVRIQTTQVITALF
ncbi:hypothetical protein M4D79_16990 [Mycolicibacterium novocastrense]|nr:hypothetical protein M4D79_16990 [Mycolicibacterium novocastrense]